MTNHPIIDAFAHTAGGYRPDVLTGFDAERHRIVVTVDDRIIGEIAPGRHGYHEMAYAYEYRGINRGRDGVTPIGPAFDPSAMQRRVVSVMFNGDTAAFQRSALKRILRK